MATVLYARVGDEVHEDLRLLARVTQLSMAVVADVILHEATGRPHPLIPVVRKALRDLREERTP